MPELHPHAALIDALGGPSKLADRLGIQGAGRVQRVQNWKYRGIPEVMLLRHPKIFGRQSAQEKQAA